MLGVDERGDTACPLRLRNGMQRNGGLTGGFWAVDLHHATTGETADAQGNVDGDVARRNGANGRTLILAQAHDGALAKVLFDLRHGQIQSLGAVSVVTHWILFLRWHICQLPCPSFYFCFAHAHVRPRGSR